MENFGISLSPKLRKREQEKTYLENSGIVRTVASVSAFGYSYGVASAHPPEPELGEIMEWTAPAFEEVCLNCEINSYASAQLQ